MSKRETYAVGRDITEVRIDNQASALDVPDVLTTLQDIRSELHEIAWADGTHPATRRHCEDEAKRVTQTIDAYLHRLGV